jgi:hypothetical protein
MRFSLAHGRLRHRTRCQDAEAQGGVRLSSETVSAVRVIPIERNWQIFSDVPPLTVSQSATGQRMGDKRSWRLRGLNRQSGIGVGGRLAGRFGAMRWRGGGVRLDWTGRFALRPCMPRTPARPARPVGGAIDVPWGASPWGNVYALVRGCYDGSHECRLEFLSPHDRRRVVPVCRIFLSIGTKVCS